MRILVLTLSFFLLASQSIADDVKGSKDHRVIKRYQDAKITRYTFKKFDEYTLVTNKIAKSVASGGNLDSSNSIKLEGKITLITYETPKQRSTLEVHSNYQDALKKAGFEILYSCSNKECGGRNFNHTMKVGHHLSFAENYKDQRYIAAKLKNAHGQIYVSMYVARNSSSGGRTKDLIYTQLNIIEMAAMEKNMVTIDASAMAKAISTKGSIALYGIHFDYDKSVLKPESKPTLEQIVKLLKDKPALKLVVVGHSDNRGKFQYNMTLSDKRAKAVVNTLIKNYGISASRLKGWGVGFLSPVASNQSEKGRGLNRRVELVQQ